MILFIIHYNSKIASIKLTMIQLSACFDQKNRTDKTYISTVLFNLTGNYNKLYK